MISWKSITLAMALLPAAVLFADEAKRIKIDRVRIVVNNLVLTDREVESLLQLESQRLRQEFQGQELEDQLKALEQTLMDRMVEDLLMENEARRLGISIDEKEINERVDNIIAREPSVAATYSEEEIKSFILKDLLKRRVLQTEVKAYIHTSPEAVRDACLAEVGDNREVHVGHVLVRGEGEAALEKILAVRQLLQDGADFRETALEHSQDPSAAQNHGDLGFISRGQFVEEFEKEAFSLEVGAISPVVETKFGYHIIIVFEERIKEGIDCDNLDDVNRARFVDRVYQRLHGERLEKFLAKLKEKAVIEVYDRP